VTEPGRGCRAADDKLGACWGAIGEARRILIVEALDPIYACEGHRLVYSGGPYVEKPAVIALSDLVDD